MKLLEKKKELDDLCKELGFIEINFLRSDKVEEKEQNLLKLIDHAIVMLKIYQRKLNGDKTAPIREIFNQ